MSHARMGVLPPVGVIVLMGQLRIDLGQLLFQFPAFFLVSGGPFQLLLQLLLFLPKLFDLPVNLVFYLI